ncbi:MAG TPA: hypothetical protein VFA18_11400, partial [Gemmataceae bacterium]|nr:hypothetical protein [Gemmataceae bacterium]
APPVGASPAERNGFVTFGSLHKLEKLNDDVLDVWCRILHEVPEARLVVGRHVLQGQTADLLRERFEKRGVAPGRLTMRTPEPHQLRHLPVYHKIDIALDAWPWNGHTTACEALWMGVPVLALYGDRHASRMTASVLHCVGLTDWIAQTPDDYVRVARTWAGRQPELACLRSER